MAWSPRRLSHHLKLQSHLERPTISWQSSRMQSLNDFHFCKIKKHEQCGEKRNTQRDRLVAYNGHRKRSGYLAHPHGRFLNRGMTDYWIGAAGKTVSYWTEQLCFGWGASWPGVTKGKKRYDSHEKTSLMETSTALV
jgi:hypothetical protein